MDIETLAVIKEKMLIARENGDAEDYKKYFSLFSKGYKEMTGKDFEEELKKYKEKNNKKDDSEKER